MDDDRFRKELLSRLDQILALLSLSCGIPEASLEVPTTAGRTDTAAASGRLTMVDEMQDNYELAMRNWKAEKGLVA